MPVLLKKIIDGLAQQSDWHKMNAPDHASILAQLGQTAPKTAPSLGTLQEPLAALAQCTPQRWAERHDALAGKLPQALAACAKKLEPTRRPGAQGAV